MKRFTKVLVACLVLFAIVFSFASCEMLRTVDKMNEIQNKMYDNGYSVDTTGDRYSMSYALGFEVDTLPVSPVYMLTAYDAFNYEFVLYVFEFESEDGLHASYDRLVEAFSCLDEVGNPILDAEGNPILDVEGNPLYHNISTEENLFIAGTDHAYSLAMDAIHESNSSLGNILGDAINGIINFVEEEIIEGIADLIENHKSGEKPSIDLYETKDKLENAGYKVSFQEGNDSVFLFASSSEGFVSFFESNNESIVTQEYQTMVEMWDEIVSEQNENGIYELTYGRNGNVVFYGSTNAVYDALGYYIEPKY